MRQLTFGSLIFISFFFFAMERFSTTLVLLAVLALTVILDTSNMATGKCAGKWAIHACVGGNGKRSDPQQEAQWKLKLAEILTGRHGGGSERRSGENFGPFSSLEDLASSADGSAWPELDEPVSSRGQSSSQAALNKSLRDLRRNSRLWKLLMRDIGSTADDESFLPSQDD